MEAIVPWSALCAVIEPHYPKAGNGRPPIALQRMLRIHLLQHWFNLADNAVDEALYDIASLRRFVGIDLGAERVPDETTVLQASGFAVKTGTIVDATLIGAPSSTKNADKARDPKMHQTRKGDSQSGLVLIVHVRWRHHRAVHPLPQLLHGKERRLYGDSAYASQKALIHSKAP